MKKLLLSVIAMITALAAHCADFTVDMLSYTILDPEAHTVELSSVGLTYPNEQVNIPETVEYDGVTYTVTSVNIRLSSISHRNISTITVPKTVTDIKQLKGEKITQISFDEGSRLKTIGKSAFSTCRFSEFNIPESVEYIGTSAFSSCNKLKSIDIPEGIDTIRARTFEYCDSLVSVKLPQGLKVIENFAFYKNGTNGPKQTYVTLPEHLDSIGSSAFSYTTIYPTATVPPALASSAFGDRVIAIIDDIPMLDPYFNDIRWRPYIKGPSIDVDGLTYQILATDKAELTGITPQSSITVPETISYDKYQLTVTGMQNDVFTDAPDAEQIKEIRIKAHMTSIGYQRFTPELTYIELPQELQHIGNNTFSGCRQLTNVNIPDSVKYIGERAFQNCGIETFTAPKKLTRIDNAAFYGCSSLKTVTLHDDITNIGNYAFYNSGIEAFTAPKKLTKIDFFTFSGCKSLKTVTLHDDITYILFGAFRESGIETFTAPKKLTRIDDAVFDGCSSLKTVTLHDDITDIGSRAFNGSAIEDIKLPANIETIYLNAIAGTKVTELRIPHTIKSINFDNSTEVTEHLKNIFITGGTHERFCDIDGVLFGKDGDGNHSYLLLYPGNRDAAEYTVPDGTKFIESYAFARSYRYPYAPTPLKKVNLPEGLQRIAHNAFAYNYSLESVNFPKSLTHIDNNAFVGDRQLIVRIPETDSRLIIGDMAFSVNTAYLDAVTPPYSNSYPSYIYPIEGYTICVKPEAVEAYRNDACWSRYRIISDAHEADGLIYVTDGDNKAELAGYIKMPDNSFDIPRTATIGGKTRTVTAIGPNALAAATFTTVNVPETVESIGQNCFGYCYNLTSVHIAEAKVQQPSLYGCICLQNISADESNAWHTTVNGMLYSKAVDTLQVYPVASACEAFVLPESVKAIENTVLYGTSSTTILKSFYSLSPTPPACGAASFNDIRYNDGITLYVPQSSVQEYSEAEGWRNFKRIVGLTDDEIRDVLTSVSEIKADDAVRPADNAFYTISGQRVTAPGKGLYIHNGKKVVVR